MKVHNWWTLAAAVLVVIIVYNILVRGTTSIGLAKIFTGFFTDTVKALEVPPEK